MSETLCYFSYIHSLLSSLYKRYFHQKTNIMEVPVRILFVCSSVRFSVDVILVEMLVDGDASCNDKCQDEDRSKGSFHTAIVILPHPVKTLESCGCFFS